MVESSFDDATDNMPLTVLSMRLTMALILWRMRHKRCGQGGAIKRRRWNCDPEGSNAFAAGVGRRRGA